MSESYSPEPRQTENSPLPRGYAPITLRHANRLIMQTSQSHDPRNATLGFASCDPVFGSHRWGWSAITRKALSCSIGWSSERPCSVGHASGFMSSTTTLQVGEVQQRSPRFQTLIAEVGVGKTGLVKSRFADGLLRRTGSRSGRRKV
jgi:hypothetical protein